MKLKRLNLAIITGAILGLFCIIGISIRMGFAGNELFILASWINRVIMGIIIGLAPKLKNTNDMIARGALFGFIISGSLYIATDFKDFTGFIAGIVYGMIIEYVASRYSI